MVLVPATPNAEWNALDHARDLARRGMAVIPVPHRSKDPGRKRWNKERHAEADLPKHFNCAPMNIGLLTGEPSGWIIDVDLDHPLAVELAPQFLPATRSIFGRAGKPRSHYLYRVTAPIKTKKFKSKKHGMIVELRSTGGQTIAPGSCHENGEQIRWDQDGDPVEIDPAELMAAVTALNEAVVARLGEKKTKPSPALPRATPCSGSTSRYTRKALENEAAAVAGACEGTRNDTLNTAAFKLGTLIGAGEMEEADAQDALTAAARECGLPDEEAKRTIQSGIEAGKAQPRQRPAAALPKPVITSSPPAEPALAEPHHAPLRPVKLTELLNMHPDLRPPVINSLLRQGETMNIIAPPKAGKSWMVTDLVLSIASGTPWLGLFDTSPGSVLIIDNELHAETIAHRIPRVAAARGIKVDGAVGERIEVQSLRGHLRDLGGMDDYFRSLEPCRYKLIILDAWYRFLPSGVQVENDNGTMAALYNQIDRYADRLKCGFVPIHHTSRGSQSSKSITDVGAGAGAQSRAADTHLILRPHKEPGVVVLEAAVRSWPPITPVCLRWEFPVWTVATDVDPADIKPERERGGTKKDVKDWTLPAFVEAFITAEAQTRDEIVAEAHSRGTSKRAATTLVGMANSKGLIYRWEEGRNRPVRYATIPPPPKQPAKGDQP